MYYITEYQDVESCDTKMAVRNNDNNKTETKQDIRRPVIWKQLVHGDWT